MMKIITLGVLIAISLLGRNGDASASRRYLAFVFVGLGALLWATTFDAVRHVSGGVPDEVLYRRVIELSAAGLLVSLVGLIASFWCRSRPLKVFGVLIGVGSAFMCGINIFLPY